MFFRVWLLILIILKILIILLILIILVIQRTIFFCLSAVFLWGNKSLEFQLFVKELQREKENMKMKEKRRVEDCTSSQRWPSSDQSLCHEQTWKCNVTAFLSENGFDTLRFNCHTLRHSTWEHSTWFLAWLCRNKYFWQSTTPHHSHHQ